MYSFSMATPKFQRSRFRSDKDDEALFGQAALAYRESLTQFLIKSGRERAERLLADRTSFSVDGGAWQEIVAAMDQPAKTCPELSRLFLRSRPE
jgi:uncharacterized protein (DUF1778 family)